MSARSDDSLNTPYNRMAFRKAATHFGAGYHRPSHHMVRETIYTLAALAPFAVGFATKDPDKRFMTLRSVAVAEAVALLAYEIATHHQKQQTGNGRERTRSANSKPQYRATVDATEENNGRGMRR
jgi:hypothetical protein